MRYLCIFINFCIFKGLKLAKPIDIFLFLQYNLLEYEYGVII